MPIDTIAHSHDLGDKGVACQRPIHGLEQQCNASIRSLGSSIKARLKESPSPGKQASKRRGGFAIHQGNGEDTDDFFIMSIGFFFPSLSQAKASEGESRNS